MRYYEKFKPKELADTQIMYLHGHGPGIFHTKKPVKKMEDLKGMKIRCTGTSAKVASALGATPVAMAQTETYDALEKGVVDGLLSPLEALKGWKFVEVTKCTTENLGSSVLTLLLRCHEQEEMGFPAQGCPGNHPKGEPGMDRENRRDLEQHGQGSVGACHFQRESDN